MTLKEDFTKKEILELALEFKKRRIYLGISQLRLSKYANLSQSIINKLENGKIDPNYSTVLRIDKALSQQEKFSNLTAEKIMIPKEDIFYLNPDAKLFEVVEIIRKNDFSQFTVLDDNRKLLGTIYEKTIFDAIANQVDIHNTTIKDYIEPNPLLVPPEYSVNELSYIFANPKTKFVLVGKGGKILGLITKSDLFKK